jgi:hypothetical protein
LGEVGGSSGFAKQNMCESDHLYGRSQLLVSSTESERGMNYVSESNATTTTTTATVNQQPTSAPEEWSVGEQQNTFPLGSKFQFSC